MVAWLVGDHLLLRYFGSYGILLFNVVVITAATVMPLRDFWAYGITIMGMCVYYFRSPIITDGQFTSKLFSFNTPVMFTEKEKAGESSCLRLTYLATQVIKLG
jgi:hypothetical protein